MQIQNEPSPVLPGDLTVAIEKAKNELLLMHGDAQRLAKLKVQQEADIISKSHEVESLKSQVNSWNDKAKEAEQKAQEATKQQENAVKQLTNLQGKCEALLKDINELKEKKEKVEAILR